jgi:signal transduction histidine kinase
VETLVDAIPDWRPPGTPGGTPSELWFVRLLEFGGTTLIGMRIPSPLEDRVSASDAALLRLQGKLAMQYFRLQRAALGLAKRAGLRRGSNGGRALRQMEMERQRLGRELHTGVGQQLAAIRQQIDFITAEGIPPSQAIQQALDRISALTADALDQVRSVSQRLHPPDWQRLPLQTALRQLWDLSGIPQGFAGTLRIDPLPAEPDLDAKVLIYRAAQEAISNLTRHSRATRVHAALTEDNGQLVFTIQDDGVGFDAEAFSRAPAQVAGGIGLRSIREQAEAAGGKFVVESSPGRTKLEITVPLKQPE